MPPETIGRYRILRTLGAGGMGEVYLAEDATLKRRVALKVVIPSGAEDESGNARLIREAQAAATLDHPNVCAIYEVGEHDGHPFFAMQYVEGQTLADRLAREPLAVPESLRVAEAIADALADAHAHGIVHRDIKPQNVMLSDRGGVKVLDFGLAKRAPEADARTTQHMTAAGVVAGTTAYMSPEQLRGETVDSSTDVFSFGCVLQEMLTGTHPFARASAAATMAAILHEPPPAPAPSVPAELQRILRKCLEKEKSRRYSSAHDLLVDLRNLTRDMSSGSASAVAAPKPSQRRAVVAAVIAAATLAAAVVAWTLAARKPAAESGARVIAILPLATRDEASAYLGDGISENVINSLSQLPESQVKVLARTTTFRYRGAGVDFPTLRRELKVDAVLTGTVQQQGDGLIVQAELINAADGTQLWGQRYSNRKLSDVFLVQEEIARAIAGSLRLELAGREAVFSKRYTDNVEAYRTYVIGREYAQRRTVTDLQAAAGRYKEAIALDNRYALAWAGLTDAYINLCSRGALPYAEGRKLALDAAKEALRLDANLAEAHAAMGQTHVYIGPFDFEEGDRSLRRAIELNPGWPIGHQYLATSLLEQGRIDEGVHELEIAHEQDPLSGFITRVLGQAHALKGDFNSAMAIYRSSMSSGPLFSTIWEADQFVRGDAVDEGLTLIASALTTRADDPFVHFSHAVLLAAKGRRTEAEAIARRFERDAKTTPVVARFAARIFMTLGEHDRALDLMARSMEGDAMPIFYKDEPLWAPVRNDPRFKALLKRMHIPD